MVIYGTKGLTQQKQAYELLALAAKEHWGLAPLPAMERLPGGKPAFSGLEERRFNLSHSGSLALCALDGQPVGVDIQVVQARRPGFPGKVCSQEELEWLARQKDHWRGFTRLWTLKECRVKQDGTGIIRSGRSIRAIRVPLSEEDGLQRLDGLWFRTYTGADWMAAACGLTPPPEEIFWRDLGAV